MAARERKPLRGMTILVTRAKKQAAQLSRLLEMQGAKVLELPVIEIRRPRSQARLDGAVRKLGSYDWLILTSVNGVEALLRKMKELKVPSRALEGLKVAAIGAATRAALEGNGVRVTVTPREYVAEALVCALRRRVAGKRVLLLRAAVARDVIPRELGKAGARVDVVTAYETTIPAGAEERLARIMSQRAPGVVTFTSSSTVHNFIKLAGKRLYSGEMDETALASIGPITSNTLRKCGLKPQIQARVYTMQGLAAAIAVWARKKNE